MVESDLLVPSDTLVVFCPAKGHSHKVPMLISEGAVIQIVVSPFCSSL